MVDAFLLSCILLMVLMNETTNDGAKNMNAAEQIELAQNHAHAARQAEVAKMVNAAKTLVFDADSRTALGQVHMVASVAVNRFFDCDFATDIQDAQRLVRAMRVRYVRNLDAFKSLAESLWIQEWHISRTHTQDANPVLRSLKLWENAAAYRIAVVQNNPSQAAEAKFDFELYAAW